MNQDIPPTLTINENSINIDHELHIAAIDRLSIIIVGSSEVGKTCILNSFLHNEFSDETVKTVCASFHDKALNIDESVVKIGVWDTAGDEKYRSIIKCFYKNVNGVVFVFNLYDDNSFIKVKEYVDEIKKEIGPVASILLGNKCDLYHQRTISSEEIEEYEKEVNIKYFEVSAKKHNTIKEAFDYLIKETLYRDKISYYKIHNNTESEKKKVKNCNIF